MIIWELIKLTFTKIHFSSGSILIVVAFLLWERFVYRRDNRDRTATAENIQNTLDKHVTEGTKVFEGIAGSLDGLNQSIHDINIVLAKQHITKADLYNEEWKDITIRIEQTAQVSFNHIKKSCGKAKCPGAEFCTQEFVIIAGEKRRDSFQVWEEQAIPRRILNIIEEVDKMIYPRALQYVKDIVGTCGEEDLSAKEKKMLIGQKCDQYKAIIVAEWKELFIEKINFKGAA